MPEDGAGPVSRDLERLLQPWLGQVRSVLDGVVAPVVVGCSGGTDSLALLALSAACHLQPVAVHVDHRLSHLATAAAQLVGRAAAELEGRSCSLPAPVPPGSNLEARARAARYEALDRARRELGASAVLVGHTRDDQAETVLLNLLRGSAAAGLAAMAPRRGDVVRPLLGLSRSDTAAICARLRLCPLEDPMNAELRYRRVWLRREVIPLLEAELGSDLRPVVARQAVVLREDSDFLEGLAAEAAERVGSPPVIGELLALPGPLARRVVRRFVALEAPGAGPAAAPAALGTVERVLEVARGERRATDLPGGDRVVRRAGRLAVTRPRSGRLGDRGGDLGPVRVTLPGTATGLGWQLESWVERELPRSWPDGRFTCVLDAQTVAEGGWTELRAPLPGERFEPLGGGTRAVRRGLAEAGVPAEERAGHPVLGSSVGEVIWVLGYRVAERFRVRPGTRSFLWVEATQQGR